MVTHKNNFYFFLKFLSTWENHSMMVLKLPLFCVEEVYIMSPLSVGLLVQPD